MRIIHKKVFTGMNMSNTHLGPAEYQECSFEHANLRNVHLEEAVFLSCNFNGDLVGATFKLSCKQGHDNDLDEARTKMFLYWLLHMFNVPEDLKQQIENTIGYTWMRRLKVMFEAEC